MKIWCGPSVSLILVLFCSERLTASPISTDAVLRSGPAIKLSSTGPFSAHPDLLEKRRIPNYNQPSWNQDLGVGWSAASHEYQALLPVDHAADTLADFYHSVVTICTAMIAQNAPLVPQGGRFSIGGLELAFGSTATPVTWTLIRAFADWMLLTTDRGFVCTYTMWLTNIASGEVIRFALKLGQANSRLSR